jgi:hypothetical protein
MQTRPYFEEAHRTLRQTRRERSVDLKYHDLNTSLLEGLMTRGDRRVGAVVEAAWRAGARLDAWREYFKPELWDAAVAECGIDREKIAHTAYSLDAELPWDHIRFYNDKEKLKKEFALVDQAKYTEND